MNRKEATMLTKTLVASEAEWAKVHSDVRTVRVHPKWGTVDSILRRHEEEIDQERFIATVSASLKSIFAEAR
jgi:hypothetical protein